MRRRLLLLLLLSPCPFSHRSFTSSSCCCTSFPSHSGYSGYPGSGGVILVNDGVQAIDTDLANDALEPAEPLQQLGVLGLPRPLDAAARREHALGAGPETVVARVHPVAAQLPRATRRAR